RRAAQDDPGGYQLRQEGPERLRRLQQHQEAQRSALSVNDAPGPERGARVLARGSLSTAARRTCPPRAPRHPPPPPRASAVRPPPRRDRPFAPQTLTQPVLPPRPRPSTRPSACDASRTDIAPAASLEPSPPRSTTRQCYRKLTPTSPTRSRPCSANCPQGRQKPVEEPYACAANPYLG